MFHYYPYFLHPGPGELLYGGMTLGPFIGGLLTQFFGWRSIFFITVLLGCVVLFLYGGSRDSSTRRDVMYSLPGRSALCGHPCSLHYRPFTCSRPGVIRLYPPPWAGLCPVVSCGNKKTSSPPFPIHCFPRTGPFPPRIWQPSSTTAPLLLSPSS